MGVSAQLYVVEQYRRLPGRRVVRGMVNSGTDVLGFDISSLQSTRDSGRSLAGDRNGHGTRNHILLRGCRRRDNRDSRQCIRAPRF